MSKPPARHQAFMREAFAVWPGYECPCGVAGCKPTVEDLARDLWVQSRVGNRPSSGAALFSVPARVERAAKDAEPTEQVKCPGCGKAQTMLAYLVRSLALRGAKVPKCDECRDPKPADPRQAWWDR